MAEYANIEAAIKAAESGDTDAQSYLGRLYWEGEEIAQNYDEAVKWLKPAAEKGNKGACHLLGVCYKHGQGLPKDETAAQAWFSKADSGAKPALFDDAKTLDEILKELDSLAGLTEAKKTIKSIIEKSKYTKQIANNHIIITGNPGTAKTSLARIITKLFSATGIISKDKPIECMGLELKGAYIGQTKGIVSKFCDDAIGGVLFIDEAYALTNANGPADEFAREAIDTLMMRLENDKDKFICIAAGYPKEMETFLKKSNPGMERRFRHFINLPDYSAEELFEIFEYFVKKDGYTLSPAAREKAREKVNKMSANRDHTFGNAREMRFLFEKISNKATGKTIEAADVD